LLSAHPGARGVGRGIFEESPERRGGFELGREREATMFDEFHEQHAPTF
jgi:hypothetical protein